MIYLHIWFLLYCVHSSRLFSDFFQSYILAKMNRMMPPQNMSGLVLPIYLESKIPHGPKVVVTLLLILCILTLALTLNHFYRPQTKFAKVIFYTCLSFCSQRGGLQAHTRGVSRPRPERGISQHALRQTPPPKQTATAADGTHPTGMHSFQK